MKRSTTILDNPAVYAGIDYHKRFSVVTLGDAAGTIISQNSLKNDEQIIRNFFLRLAPWKCAIENCRGNEWFVDLLKQSGCDVKVSNTYAVRLIAQSTKKNDKIDSKILMELLAKDYLPTCYQPTQEERLLRERLRWRTRLMRSRTQYKNVAHALMDKENKGKSVTSKKARKEIHENPHLSQGRQERLRGTLKLLNSLRTGLQKRMQT